MDTLERDNKDKYFKGQQKDETFICFFRHHWFFLLKDIISFTIFLIITVIAIIKIEAIKDILRGNREIKLFFVTIVLIGTVYFHKFFLNILNYFINIGIITDTRIIDHQKSLYFKDNIDAIDMSQIQNMEKIEDGILPSLLKFGDIRIFLTASKTEKTFRQVPNVKFHFRCISRQKEARQMVLLRDRGELNPDREQKNDLREILKKS